MSIRFALRLHPRSPRLPVTRVVVEMVRTGPAALALTYVVEGAIDRLLIPARAAPARVDGLWEHSCFEAFVDGVSSYLELNFSPSTSWAAYRFAGRPKRMTLPELGPPQIETRATADRFELRARAQLAEVPAGKLALSAVIEDKEGRKSYWALAHPPGRPNFHHRDGFIGRVPAADGA